MQSNFLPIAIRASLEAGAAILDVYNSPDFGIEQKEDDSPLTKADSASHEIIAKLLAVTEVPVLSEEDAKNHSYADRSSWNQCWIVDPLDGTKEFIKRNGEFTVNIALVENGFPVMGVIYVPVTDELYFSNGANSFKLEKASHHIPAAIADGALKQIKTMPVQDFPKTFTMVGSRSHSSPETEAFVKEMEAKHGAVDFVAAGSSLKFCLLAEGKAHSYPRFAPTMEWDTAAGQAILEAAGGSVVEWPGQNRMHYNRENLRNGWFLANAKA